MLEIDKTIIGCALTGSIHVPSMFPHLPITPADITKEGVAAAEAGTSIIHIHVRDPVTGEPSLYLNLFHQVAENIKSQCNAIVQPTTGVAVTMSVNERAAAVP